MDRPSSSFPTSSVPSSTSALASWERCNLRLQYGDLRKPHIGQWHISAEPYRGMNGNVPYPRPGDYQPYPTRRPVHDVPIITEQSIEWYKWFGNHTWGASTLVSPNEGSFFPLGDICFIDMPRSIPVKRPSVGLASVFNRLHNDPNLSPEEKVQANRQKIRAAVGVCKPKPIRSKVPPAKQPRHRCAPKRDHQRNQRAKGGQVRYHHS